LPKGDPAVYALTLSNDLGDTIAGTIDLNYGQ
jgi:hypothetical protein